MQWFSTLSIRQGINNGGNWINKNRRIILNLIKWIITSVLFLGISFFVLCRLEVNAHVYIRNWFSPPTVAVVEPLSKCFQKVPKDGPYYQGNQKFTANFVPGIPVWEAHTCYDFAALFKTQRYPFHQHQSFHTYWSSNITTDFDEKPLATLRSFSATQNTNHSLTLWIPAHDESRLTESSGWTRLSVFKEQLDLLRQKYALYKDVSPSNKLSLEFITENKYSHLEEFQPHRRIFGMIALLDYQEWKTNKNAVYGRFHELLEKYPETTARCFVFNNNTTLDIIPSLIFSKQHLNEMLSCISDDILYQISVKIEQIKNLQTIESPPAYFSTHYTEQQQQKKSRISSNSSTIASSLRSSIFSPPPSPTLSSATIFSVDHDLTKQRTPGRICKLLGDHHLLVGNLDAAEEDYKKAIELCKPFYDYLWVASAKEGIACIAVLRAYFDSITPESLENAGSSKDPAQQDKTIIETVVDLYEHITYYYLLVDTSASKPIPAVIYSESCLKIARFLSMIFLSGKEQVDNDILFNIIHKRDFIRQGKIATIRDLIKCKASKIPRFSIAKWISKIWLIELNEMSLVEQIQVMTHMSFILSNIGYHRKAAWFISEALEKMLPFIIQNDYTSIHTQDDILFLLKFMCKLHGIQEKKNNTYEVPDGWTVIQLDILKQCIIISEALQDDRHVVYYATLILKNMSKHISKEEQIYFANLTHRTSNTNQLISTYPNDTIKYSGPTLLMCLEYTHSLSWKSVYKNTFRNKVDSEEPFYYNPFLNKRKKKTESSVYVVKNQECQFRVILGNPFNYDIEISSIIPRSCGVEFKSTSPSLATIPSNQVISLDLIGTPLETGLLKADGCRIKLKGFAEADFFPKEHACTALESLDDIKYSDFHLAKYLEEQECKIGQLLNVIDEQPLLTIKSTSIVDKSMTLFEGENFTFHLQVENIGNIPVNYIRFSFKESNHLYIEVLSDHEQYEMEKRPLFTWMNDSDCDIAPGQCVKMSVSAIGKRGCTNGEIYIDYGYSNHDYPEYTRQLYLPITVSVYQHLQLSNWHFSRLHPELDDSIKEGCDPKISTLEEQLKSIRYLVDPVSGSSAYFLLFFDIYNSWPNAFDVEFDTDELIHQKWTILPGYTKRVVLPLKKLYLSPEKTVEPIPNKQIIVSQEKKNGRALFWYQQLLRKHIKAKWSDHHYHRKGSLEFDFDLNLDQLDILKEQDLKFNVVMRNMNKTLGFRRFECSLYTSVTMNVTIFNKHDYPVKLILRIQPTQRYDGNVRDYDLKDKLLFEGLTQLVLPEIPANGSVVHSLPLIFISCGQYEFLHHIENIHTREILYDHDWVSVHAL
ncbi:hypothetical protein K501DRAFT_330098 [Backusella circina FSU 941]|nr:hypothetical protein K501DRAFT_330098 [Backusella circina FSU 941]